MPPHCPADGSNGGPRLVLASASPARLATLRAAGIAAEVMVSGVDESSVTADDPERLCARLATAKAAAVADRLAGEQAWVIGCDSVLELDGRAYGKPGSAAAAVARWRSMRGRSGVLHTGHCVRDVSGAASLTRVASTTVHFADVSDDEIEAYAASGEPLRAAGAFTLDGLGGAFLTAVDGDPHTVVGISPALLRAMLAELGVAWLDVWPRPAGVSHIARHGDR